MGEFFDTTIGKLGFGLMRLPKKEDKTMDLPQICDMVDRFLEAGFNYFDTAYIYDDGDSEKIIKEALVKRHPRDSYFLATKLNAWFGDFNRENTREQIYTSLERTGAGYFDFYLLHAMVPEKYHLYEEWGLWDYIRELKEKGLVKHWGFSFHASPEVLEELLTKHPDAEFVQLQINYADMENPNVQSRACYEIARKHGKPIVIMEPVKGGLLANPNPDVVSILKEANPDASLASWALRYAASLDGIMTVLSGMSTIGQMEDNLSFMKDFKPLSKEELEVISKAQDALTEISIPCTACHYCCDGCPMQIPIPEIFSARNKQLVWHQDDEAKADYKKAIDGKGSAADCVQCGQCEGACPQGLKIITYLQDCVKELA